MISKRKEYIAKLFLKKCTKQSVMKAHLEFSLKLMNNTYSITEEALVKLKEEYNLDNYIKRLMPLLDKQFTIEEMQEAIKFFSSGVGKKMLDPNLLQKIGKVGSNMVAQLEQEFALGNIE